MAFNKIKLLIYIYRKEKESFHVKTKVGLVCAHLFNTKTSETSVKTFFHEECRRNKEASIQQNWE